MGFLLLWLLLEIHSVCVCFALKTYYKVRMEKRIKDHTVKTVTQYTTKGFSVVCQKDTTKAFTQSNIGFVCRDGADEPHLLNMTLFTY